MSDDQEVIPKLTDKQQAFLNSYLVDFNGTKAAIEAGYSENSASVIASQNLKKPEIQNAIRMHQIELARNAKRGVDWVLAELFERYACLVAKEDDKGAVKCLELIGRHYGAFPNKVELPPLDPDAEMLPEIQMIERARRLVFFLHSVKKGESGNGAAPH